MDIATACEYLTLGESSLRALIDSRTFKPVTIGKLVRLRKEELDDWIENLTYIPADRRTPIGTEKALQK